MFKKNKTNEEKLLQGDYITDADETVDDNLAVVTDQPLVMTGGSDAVSQFYEWPITRPDGSFQGISYLTSGHLLDKGVNSENLRAANLLSIVMLSARLGYPISILIIPENLQAAQHILSHCLDLVPKDAVIECQDFKPDYLYIGGGGHLNGKCIISSDVDGFSKVRRELESIISSGSSVRHEIEKGRYDISLAEHRAKMQLSVIGVDGGKPGKQFSHPSFLNVPISARQLNFTVHGAGIKETYGLQQAPVFKLRKTFQRLKPRQVDIPFEEQLAKAIANSGCENAPEKMEILKNMVSVCAILNQPPPVQMAELGALIYGTDEKEVGHWLIDAGIEKELEVDSSEVIVATKVDYYLARLLLDGLLTTGQTHFNDRQRAIFETIKKINLDKTSATMLGKMNDVEVLASIARNTGFWADREKIFEEVNKTGSYPLSTVSRDLASLLETGVVERGKPPKRRSFGYYVVTMNLNDAIQLPVPEDIQDPVFEGKPVLVVNPITGEAETI